jgi:hypothetical protein
MKRFLPLIPFFLFIFLNACGNTPAEISPSEGTAVGQTQTAVMWTPTITHTPDPNESRIVEWLNEGLSAADPLEKTLDAIYQIQDVWFPLTAGNSYAVFQVDIRCQCAINTGCCIPERMFVVTMYAMKNHADKIMEQMPGNINEVKVLCINNGSRIAMMAASWTDVMGYLIDQINGYQLGSRVYRSTIP